MQYLKTGVAATIMFGPFVDKTDGITLKTDATTITDIDHATTGIFLSKAGAAAAIRSQAVTASVADAYGMMKVTLSLTDTGTVGTLDVLFAKAATYLPVHKCFMVLPALVYDSLIGGTDNLQVDTIQWIGVAPLALSSQQVQAVVPTTQKVDVDTIKTQAVTCAAGVTVLASVGTAATATAQTGDCFPLVSTEVAEIYAAVITNAAGVDIAADIIAAKADTVAILADVGDASASTLGSLYAILGNAAATLTGRIPAALGADGFIKASLFGAMGTALTETAGQITAGIKKFFDVGVPVLTCESANQVQDNATTAEIKTAIEAAGSHLTLIKTQTDKLAFTIANQVDANVQYVNDTQLTGNGGATPWGPA